jgi:hypothetical protein
MEAGDTYRLLVGKSLRLWLETLSGDTKETDHGEIGCEADETASKLCLMTHFVISHVDTSISTGESGIRRYRNLIHMGLVL